MPKFNTFCDLINSNKEKTDQKMHVTTEWVKKTLHLENSYLFKILVLNENVLYMF